MMLLLQRKLVIVCSCVQFIHFPVWGVQPIATFWRIPFVKCLKSCELSEKCDVIGYNRQYALCLLYKGNNTLSYRTPGLKKSFVNKNSQLESLCSRCFENETCKISNTGVNCTVDYCQPPEEIAGAIIEGNIFTVGAKAQYKCPGTSMPFPITCLSTGKWSDMNVLICNCTLPGDIPGEPDYQEVSAQDIELRLSCDPGYALLGTPAKCNTQTGHWTYGIHMTECCFILDPPWRKIHSFTNGGIVPSWKEGPEFITCRHFRNSSIFGNWQSFVEKRIRLNVIKDEQVVHFIIFSGTTSTTESWFAGEKIIESSWIDLDSSTATGLVSIEGDRGESVRFVVGQNLQGRNNCEHTGWFVVNWGYYPCETPIDYDMPVIVFSKGNTVARFRESEVEIADMFEVWIEE